MKHVTEFRNREAALAIAKEIAHYTGDRKIRIMEICGGHTISIFKYGLRELLPKSIRLISGPGCPVCVTPNTMIDHALALCQQTDARGNKLIVTSFGDMIRVPGSRTSLGREKAQGGDVRICYSPLDALAIARDNRDREVVFLGIGFETTAPTIGAVIKRAKQEGLKNFSVLSALKTMPQAMRALVQNGDVGLDAFICPGHVSAITGKSIYEFVAHDFKLPCVISGFEPLDMLEAIRMITKQIAEGRAAVENEYNRAIKNDGNPIAQALLEEVFEPCDSGWRGIGVIPGSGLGIKKDFAEHDAAKRFPVELPPTREHPSCICGDIMRGLRTPTDCTLFSKACTPEHPVGACMVSDEGSCATYFKYAR
jgi:hydrogenase expression/formation protein HypD